MFHVIKCGSSKCVGSFHTPEEAVECARKVSDDNQDGLAHTIWQDGNIVGSCVDGYTGKRHAEYSYESVLDGRYL